MPTSQPDLDGTRALIDLCPTCGGVTVAQHEELGRLARGRQVSPSRCTAPELHKEHGEAP